MIKNNNIPIGTTYDKSGNKLTYKNSDGSWSEYTRDEFGNELTYKDSGGYWYEYTRDEFGTKLTYKASNGAWHEYTRDEFGNELAYKSSKYPDVLFTAIAKDDRYTSHLGDNAKYLAGCRYFTKEEAIAHWSRKRVTSKERATLFLKAIDKS